MTKKIISCLFYFLFSFILINSCSKEASEDIGIDLVQPEPVAPVVKYQLSVTAAEGGTVSTSGGEFVSGSPITVTATPNSGYSFVNWTGDGSSTSASFTFNILANTNLTANFQTITYSYNLVLAAGDGGAVSSEGGEYEEGSEITFSAIPDEGFEFVEWSDGNTEIERSITLTGDTNLSALFQVSVKEIDIKFEGKGRLFIRDIQNNTESVIENTEDITTNYLLNIEGNKSYRVFVKYEQFQNKLVYDSSLIDFSKNYSLNPNYYGYETFLLNINSPEIIELKIDDQSLWTNEEAGEGLSSFANVFSIDFLTVTPRVDGVQGRVNCLKRLDVNSGSIIKQDCFYSESAPYGLALGSQWKNHQFFWNNNGLLTFAHIDRPSIGERHARIQRYDNSFVPKGNFTFSDIDYVYQSAYNKIPILHKSGDYYSSFNYKKKLQNFFNVEDYNDVFPGIGVLSEKYGQFYMLAQVRSSELTSSGQVVKRKTYLVRFRLIDYYPDDILYAILLSEKVEDGGDGAFATSHTFRITDKWLELGGEYLFMDFLVQPESDIVEFNGSERNYGIAAYGLGTIFRTWPGIASNKYFALGYKEDNISSIPTSTNKIREFYFYQFTNGELTYSKLLKYEMVSKNSNVGKLSDLYNIYSYRDDFVIVISSDGKTMRLDIN
jgi:uncharacterized repeat protein (TIGR02543 family)